MSIFSDNIITDLKVGEVYAFAGIKSTSTYNLEELDVFNDAIKNTFSNIKILNYIDSHNTREDGSKMFTNQQCDEFIRWFKSRFAEYDTIFISLIVMLLLMDGLNEEYINKTFNSIIRDFKLKKGANVVTKITYSKNSAYIQFIVSTPELKLRFSIILNLINSISD